MNTITKILAFLTVTVNITFGQVVYTWVGSLNGSWNIATNWNPSRTNGQVTDVLVFNSGNQVYVNSVQQQTIGQLLISNNTSVVLSPASGNPRVLSINGNNGEDLVIESGSELQLSGNDPSLGIFLKNSATASINGSIVLRGTKNHTINAQDENSIVFYSGSSFRQDCPGFAFTNTGSTNVVVFKSGSLFISSSSNASNPFGLQAPSSKVVFESGSTFSQQNSTMAAEMFSGRTFANLEFDMNVNVQYSENMTSNAVINNIIVKNNSIFSFSNTNYSFNALINLKGDLNVNGSFIMVNDPNNKVSISFNGINQQNISGSGIISLPASMKEVKIENINGVVLGKNITAGCPVIVIGKLNLLNSLLTGNVTVMQNGTMTRNNGYINGSLTKYINKVNPSAVFEIGTENGYSPVTLYFFNIENEGYITVKAVQTIHPSIENPSEAMRRYWSITNSGLTFDSYNASFNYLSNDFNTNFSELTDEKDMVSQNLQSAVSLVQDNLEITSRDTTNNRIEISNIKSFGDFTNKKNNRINENLIINNIPGSENNNVNNSIPSSFGLSQNYPNPFNPSTKIDYQMPFNSMVTIKIYDINGKEIVTLINESKTAGYHTVEFNSNGIASGVYFYSIIANSKNGSFNKTLKMVIVK